MPDIRYDAHPSLLRSLGLSLSTLDVHLLRWIGLGLSAVALLQLLGWWIAGLTDHLEIAGDEILWTHGLLNKQYTEINSNAVRTVRVQQTLLQRILNAGDVSLYTTGDAPELVVRGLPDPGRIRELIKAQTSSGSEV